MGELDIDAEKKEMEPGASETSTIQAPIDDDKGGEVNDEKVGEDGAPAEIDYPQGLRLVIVLLAIVFSVFLLALDQVSRHETIKIMNIILTHADHRRHSHP